MVITVDTEEVKAAIVWVRPSGREITTVNNPDTIEYAKSLGWKRRQAVKAQTKPNKATYDNSKDNRQQQLKAL